MRSWIRRPSAQRSSAVLLSRGRLSSNVAVLLTSGMMCVAAERTLAAEPQAVVREVTAHRIAGSPDAQAIRLSLPLPRGFPRPLVPRDGRTQVQPVGFWPEERTGETAAARRVPRRVLLFSCAPATDTITLGPEQFGFVRPDAGFQGPEARVDILDHRYESQLPWEVNELVFSSGQDSLGIRVGLKVGDEYHWWQWVRLETIEDGPVCRTVRAMGAVPVVFERHESEDAQGLAKPGRPYPWLHKHNHIRGEVLARLYANGVIELSIRHLNGRFFTEGDELHGVVPVIGFRAPGGDWPETPNPVTGQQRWRWTGASLDNAEAAHLVSASHPGLAWREDDVCIYQPYEGVEPMAGSSQEARTGDPYLCRATQQVFPKGMARTIRMVAALGSVAPEVAVYLLPDWWYGLAEDLCEKPMLPVRDHTFETVEKAFTYYHEAHHAGCFDDGAVCRSGSGGAPGWEGEAPYAQMVAAYLSGQPLDYGLALRSAYHLADVATDKALFAVRMHGYGPPAQSLPMQRILGLVSAYLETGDPYLLDVATAVAETSYSWDRFNWPRRSFGRDAAYIRGLVMLHRYLGDRQYLDKARDAIYRLISCQLPDGSFTDQGGTTGIHAAMDLIVKPWMGCIATESMLDYLALEHDERLEAAALRFARWLLECRRQDENGRFWVYQVSHGGKRGGYEPDGKHVINDWEWYDEYLGRILTWASLTTGEPEFYEAWLEGYRRNGVDPRKWDHGANKIVLNLPVARALLWNPKLTADGVRIEPRVDLAPDLEEALVSTPSGRLRVSTSQAEASRGQ